MIRAIKIQGDKFGSVSGHPAEVIMFHQFWQAKLWPKWIEQSHLGAKNDPMTRELTEMLKVVKEGFPLTLADQGDKFEEAFVFAVEQCKAIGINVIETPAAA